MVEAPTHDQGIDQMFGFVESAQPAAQASGDVDPLADLMSSKGGMNNVAQADPFASLSGGPFAPQQVHYLPSAGLGVGFPSHQHAQPPPTNTFGSYTHMHAHSRSHPFGSPPPMAGPAFAYPPQAGSVAPVWPTQTPNQRAPIVTQTNAKQDPFASLAEFGK